MKILFKNRKTIEFLSGLDELSGNADMKQTIQVELDVPLNTARESLWMKLEQGYLSITHEILFNYAYTAFIPNEVISSAGTWSIQLFVREYDSVSGSYITKATSQKATFTMPESMQLEDGTLVTNATVAGLYAGQAQLGERTGAIDERLSDLELDYKETAQDLIKADQHLADAEKDIERISGTVGGFDGRIKHAEELVEDANERSQQNASDIVGLRQDFVNESHFRGYVETDAEFETLYGNANDYAYSLQSGTTWVYQQDNGWVNTEKPAPTSAAPLSNATPLVDGEASAGTATAAARGDHRHPSDPTKVGFTDYPGTAAGGEAGVVKVDTYYGFNIGQAGSAGVLKPIWASNAEIEGKSDRRFINPNNFGYALKLGLTTNTEPWTDEDKAKACATIGATRWYKHVVVARTTYGSRFFTLVSPVSTKYTNIKTFGEDCLLYGAFLYFEQGFKTKVTSVYTNGTEEAGYSVIVGFADDSDGFSGLDLTGINNETVMAL